MATTTERAILAGGCFWGMQQLVQRFPGVVSTRVGYSGGDVKNATYRNHGTHAEAIEITFDPEQNELPQSAGVLLPDPRSDNTQPAGKRPRHELQVGDLLHERGAAPRRRGHDRRRRSLRAVAGQGRDRALARRRFLGSGARAPGLPGTIPERLHLPLRPPGLEVAAAIPVKLWCAWSGMMCDAPPCEPQAKQALSLNMNHYIGSRGPFAMEFQDCGRDIGGACRKASIRGRTGARCDRPDRASRCEDQCDLRA